MSCYRILSTWHHLGLLGLTAKQPELRVQLGDVELNPENGLPASAHFHVLLIPPASSRPGLEQAIIPICKYGLCT